MKKIIILLCLLSTSLCMSQEWFTSFSIAKKLALLQDKMLFVMWEESTNYPFQVIINGDNGAKIQTDLFEDEEVNKLIWKHFVPVILYESTYEDLFNEIKNKRGARYIQVFQDEGIKIMDANGNILNTRIQNHQSMDVFNLSMFIDHYALKTSYLKPHLNSYSKKKSFATAFNLGKKYLDVSIVVHKKLKKEIIELAGIYFVESKELLERSNLNNKAAFKQKFDLLEIKQFLILDKPKKVLRMTKKLKENEIATINQSLFSFLNYTAFKMLKKENKAALWKSKVSLVDLKKAELIIKYNF